MISSKKDEKVEIKLRLRKIRPSNDRGICDE